MVVLRITCSGFRHVVVAAEIDFPTSGIVGEWRTFAGSDDEQADADHDAADVYVLHTAMGHGTIGLLHRVEFNQDRPILLGPCNSPQRREEHHACSAKYEILVRSQAVLG